jgi:superfamily I DNA/RNA helicase
MSSDNLEDVFHLKIQFRRAYRFSRIVERLDLISFADIADWCARRAGGVERDEALRMQAYRDLEQSVLKGEFGPANKPIVAFLPRTLPMATLLAVSRYGLQRKLITCANLFASLTAKIAKNKNVVFDFAVVDEAQDISVAHLKFFAALGGGRPNALFFAGDLGQRIFQQPFSWKALGVDIRGRSRTLRVNYRTSHQIRAQADRLLGPGVVDMDGNAEDRSDTVSVFNGPPPTVRAVKNESEETKTVGNWIAEQAKAGVMSHEFGVFVRSEAELGRAKAAVKEAGLAFKILDEHVETVHGHASISTMHLAKGLEFRAVVVMACDDEIIPLQERIETVGDDADLQEVYDTERQLLYVACTRARDYLLVTGVQPVSEFLDDLRG